MPNRKLAVTKSEPLSPGAGGGSRGKRKRTADPKESKRSAAKGKARKEEKEKKGEEKNEKGPENEKTAEPVDSGPGAAKDPTADAEAEAKRQLREQQKQLMRFKRSREGPPPKAGDTCKCPQWLRDALPPPKSQAFRHWFNMWVQSDGDWGKVMLTEILRRKQMKKTTKGWRWMMKSEVEDKYTPAVAEALLVACHDNPAWNKKHLQADCPEAHLYHILETEITEEIEEHSAEQELKLMMELDGTVPKELSASLPGLNGFDVGGGSGSGQSPHKAIEDKKEHEAEKKK